MTVKEQFVALCRISWSDDNFETQLKDLVEIGFHPTLLHNGFTWLAHLNVDSSDFAKSDYPATALKKAMAYAIVSMQKQVKLRE